MIANAHKSSCWLSTILFLFVILITVRAGAFAADAGSLISGEFNANERTVRVEIAKDILTQIELLDSYLLNTKPSELSWIEMERAAIDKLKGTDAWGTRMGQFYESPEFQNQKLKALLSNVRKGLECVINDKVKTNSEILCWAVVVHNLSDKATLDDSIAILVKHGRLPPDIAKKARLVEATGFGTKFTWYARGIQEFIVIPYLAGNMK
jgi:hypothetical protein